MQLQASKLVFLPTHIPSSEFSSHICPQELHHCEQPPSYSSTPSPISSLASPSSSLNNYKSSCLFELPSPLFSILLAYSGSDDFKGLEVQVELELFIKGDKIPYRLIEAKKQGIFVYKCVQVDICDCFDKPILCLATVKSCQPDPVAQKGEMNVEQLAALLSTRSFNLQNTKTLCTYRREFIIRDPVSIHSRYSSKGYLLLKIGNDLHQRMKTLNTMKSLGEICNLCPKWKIRIISVKLMNWFVGDLESEQRKPSPYLQQVRKFESKNNLPTILRSGVELNEEEEVSYMLSINANIINMEIPYAVQFELDFNPGYRFKMIKYAKI